MEPKPNPSDFTFNGVLQQPHYDYAVRAWEKMEGMEEAAEEYAFNLSLPSFYEPKKEAFKAGAEWQKEQLPNADFDFVGWLKSEIEYRSRLSDEMVSEIQKLHYKGQADILKVCLNQLVVPSKQ